MNMEVLGKWLLNVNQRDTNESFFILLGKSYKQNFSWNSKFVVFQAADISWDFCCFITGFYSNWNKFVTFGWKQGKPRQVSSMIHSARPIVMKVANIVFCCVVFLDLKSGDGRTDNMCENNDPYRPWLWVGSLDQL